MKKLPILMVTGLLLIAMLLGTLVACAPSGNGEISSTSDSSQTESSTETSDAETADLETSESETAETGTSDANESTDEETTDDDEITSPSLSGEHGPLIEHAHSLAHNVQAFFPNADRKIFNVQNSEMTLAYARSTDDKQLISSIKNTKGKSYIENTMDVFIKMKNGNVFYASDSFHEAQVNLFRYGYYYFDNDFVGQSFMPKNFAENATGNTTIDLKDAYIKNGAHNVKSGLEKDGFKILVTDNRDPYATFGGFEYSTSDYNVLSVTLKATDISRLRIYVDIGDGIQHDHMSEYVAKDDGEFHTYLIPLFTLDGDGVYDGTIKKVRLDPEGCEINGSLTVKEISLSKADVSDIPTSVLLNRKFHVYSDKMHHEIQLNTSKDVENVASVGTYTEIDKSTVDKLLVVDKDGKTYASLDGIKWTNIAAVAFDVKDAGIFGFIMPYDGKGGTITVSEKDGNYIIIQEIVPENNTLVPSLKGSKNEDDLYTGCRIYTDENHDFEEFLFENFCEQNPLTAKNIKVSNASSDNGEFGGYNSLRGIYSLKVGSPVGHFWTPYNDPNKHYKVNFTISAGEVARDIYIMSDATNGLLECAALLDEDMMMLPMPIEVIKNFNDMHDFYNIDDYTFSEAIIPLTLDADKKYEYNLVNLYQNWGKFPLKQISQIPFHVAYYHLSTGVSETNCITPWFMYTYVGKPQSGLYTLPDHRPMSAPMWDTEPQHTYGGTHHWLEYTDSDGKFVSVENIYNTVDSFGPTYAEVVMDHISDDGKMQVTYTHMEMPQTDENRTYYTMEYTVLEDLTINDVKNKFQFYSVTSNDSTGVYQNVSYLDKDNKSAYVDANKSLGAAPEYVLGDNCPYFAFYNIPGQYDPKSNPEGYSFAKGYTNMSFIIHDYDFTVGGEAYDPQFLLINSHNQLKLTLNTDTLTLKAGDKITINAILMPWGSQESVYDRSNGLAPDQNVIDARENTCLDPLTVKSETDEIIGSTYVPRVKSKNGKSAEFTLSGCKNENGKNAKGNYNVAVRVYGFDLLTAPKIEEFVDGKWVEYVVSSKDTPIRGSYHYYDGYCVYYDGDGTYSYSFVVDMTEGKDRKFRITADTDFAGWPAEVPIIAEDPLKLYLDSNEIADILGTQINTQTSVDGNVDFISIYQKSKVTEFYSTIFAADDATEETGQYFVFKYRIPTTNTVSTPYLEFFTSTANKSVSEGHNFRITPKYDGEWHVVVVDVSSIASHPSFKPTDSKYVAQYIRADFFNEMDPKAYNADNHVDFAYIGMDSSLEEICKINSDLTTITLYENKVPIEIDTTTGEKYEPTYVHPDSGYTEAEDILFFGFLDSVSGTKVGKGTSSLEGAPVIISGVEITPAITLTLSGWCVLDGGVESYAWSVDGGRTWNIFEGSNALDNADDAIFAYAQSCTKNGFTNKEADTKNGAFQESNILTVNLKDYEGKNVDVILGAITAKDTKNIVPLYVFENVSCSIKSIFDSSSVYTESSALYYSILEGINKTVPAARECSNSRGYLKCNGISADENGILSLKGWAAVDGGISKYVWTADGGKTWNDCGGSPADSYQGIIDSALKRLEGTPNAPDDIKINGCFQEGGQKLVIDLSSIEISSEPITIYVAAVNATNESKVTVLYCLSNVEK